MDDAERLENERQANLQLSSAKVMKSTRLMERGVVPFLLLLVLFGPITMNLGEIKPIDDLLRRLETVNATVINVDTAICQETMKCLTLEVRFFYQGQVYIRPVSAEQGLCPTLPDDCVDRYERGQDVPVWIDPKYMTTIYAQKTYIEKVRSKTLNSGLLLFWFQLLAVAVVLLLVPGRLLNLRTQTCSHPEHARAFYMFLFPPRLEANPEWAVQVPAPFTTPAHLACLEYGSSLLGFPRPAETLMWMQEDPGVQHRLAHRKLQRPLVLFCSAYLGLLALYVGVLIMGLSTISSHAADPPLKQSASWFIFRFALYWFPVPAALIGYLTKNLLWRRLYLVTDQRLIILSFGPFWTACQSYSITRLAMCVLHQVSRNPGRTMLSLLMDGKQVDLFYQPLTPALSNTVPGALHFLRSSHDEHHDGFEYVINVLTLEPVVEALLAATVQRLLSARPSLPSPPAPPSEPPGTMVIMPDQQRVPDDEGDDDDLATSETQRLVPS